MLQHPETTEREARWAFRTRDPSAECRGRRMNFHQQAAMDRHAWRIFKSYLP
jgi:hypothetical protein